MPVVPLYYVDGADLKCAGFDRDLVVAELAQLRVLTVTQRVRVRPRYANHRTVLVTDDEGLGQGYELSQTRNGTASRWRFTGVYDAGTTHTIEMWVRMHVTQTNANRCLWEHSSPTYGVFWNIGATMYFKDSTGYKSLGPELARGSWRYIAAVMNGGHVALPGLRGRGALRGGGSLHPRDDQHAVFRGGAKRADGHDRRRD